MVTDNKIIKGLAFEKALMEILSRKNVFAPQAKEKIFNKFVFNGVIYNKLDLSDFGLPTIRGNKIAIEIKAGKIGREIVDGFINRVPEEYETVVFFLAGITPRAFKEIYYCKKFDNILESYECNNKTIYFIDQEYLVKNEDLKAVLKDFDHYIVKEKNILIDDNYQLLLAQGEISLSFALGAGCSIASNISDWNTLSRALGYELLFNLVDTNDSAYKNMLLTNELNDAVFKCYEKNSALDAIYTYYSSSASVKKVDYWMAIKKVLYMSYNNTTDAHNKLLTSINQCIARHNIKEIINYNFDSVLEQNIKPNYKSNPKEVEGSITNLNGCCVYHVHGYIPYDYSGKAKVNNLVFTDNEYYENMINKSSFCNSTQKRILNHYNTIFVGVSFTDQNMKEILRDRVQNGSTTTLFGFLKLPSFDLAGTGKELIKSTYKFMQQCYFDSLGVKIIWVNDYDEIPKMIDKI